MPSFPRENAGGGPMTIAFVTRPTNATTAVVQIWRTVVGGLSTDPSECVTPQMYAYEYWRTNGARTTEMLGVQQVAWRGQAASMRAIDQ